MVKLLLLTNCLPITYRTTSRFEVGPKKIR